MASHSSDTDVESVVRRYYATVADLSSTEEDLRALLSPGVRVVEHPNAVTPAGAERDLTAVITGFRAGKALLQEQAFEVHEVVSSGPRAAVRATWRGVVAADAGPLRAGERLVAHVAALLTVRGGVVVEHETFDCYEPFPPETIAADEPAAPPG
jgi:ketosteroid isomerase-like protein